MAAGFLDLTDAVAIKGRFWQGFELVNWNKLFLFPQNAVLRKTGQGTVPLAGV